MYEWDRRKKKLENEWSNTAWALSVMPDIWEDVKVRLTGVHRDAIGGLVKKLHLPPCPNPNKEAQLMDTDEVIDVFWDEF